MESFAEHYTSLQATLEKYMPGTDMTIIQQAIDYAQDKHKEQKRKDGSPYIIHPLAVAEIVAEMGLDTDAVLGAILHAVSRTPTHPMTTSSAVSVRLPRNWWKVSPS